MQFLEPMRRKKKVIADADKTRVLPPPDRDERLDWYDLVVAQSFPASDPPPLCVGVGGAAEDERR